MNILYIGPKMIHPKNGGDRIELRNQVLLEKYCKANVTYFSPDFNYTSLSIKLKLSIGLTAERKAELKRILHAHNFYLVFVSQSTYGGYVKYIKSISNITIITFFHNAEINYFVHAHNGETNSFKGLHYIAKVLWNEYYSAKKSDKIITLNERDSIALKKYYGKSANLILPTTFEDTFNENNDNSSKLDIDCLFVGSSFFANTEGLQWFIDNVFPYIKGNLYIIGNGMDSFKFSNLSDRIHKKGFVDNLTSYYNRAKLIISPIFSGSGMKTKTAEALMFGKIIIGTQEAFEGYEVNPGCMILCNTADEFITSINRIVPQIKHPINTIAREHFKENYSNGCVVQRLKVFLHETIGNTMQ